MIAGQASLSRDRINQEDRYVYENMGPGMNMGMPDVCNTPTPVGPVPIPYPNIAMDATAAGGVMNLLVAGLPALNAGSEITVSNGDNAGAAGGVVSGMMMGPTRFMVGSVTVMGDGMPIQHMTSVTGQNGMSPNCPGVAMVPGQFTVLVMS
ncbi:DUF4150 domain-containing protein [Dongshaea marina]|uniref:DUF4150 domain-containing protein n=1 Tax=Dongshaea marina TaxID=2047966 RepID=UPI0019013B86|nr:DUF4150 domain-containing protein [Dongshaea marina]